MKKGLVPTRSNSIVHEESPVPGLIPLSADDRQPLAHESTLNCVKIVISITKGSEKMFVKNLGIHILPIIIFEGATAILK